MITDDVDNRAVCTSGVMQVRQPVRHSWPEMQQSGRRLAGDARVPVRSASHHPFEQTQHRTHLWSAVQRGDEMHFRCAGVGETDVDPPGDQVVDHNMRARSHSLILAIGIRAHQTGG